MPDPEKIFFTGECPACGKGKARIKRTERPIQEACCTRCGVRWKVVSVNLYFENALNDAAEIDQNAQKVKYDYSFLLKDR